MPIDTPVTTPSRPLRSNGVGRNTEWPKSLLFYFDGVPSDDQMRYLSEVVQRACACMPEDLCNG